MGDAGGAGAGEPFTNFLNRAGVSVICFASIKTHHCRIVSLHWTRKWTGKWNKKVMDKKVILQPLENSSHS